MLMYTSAHSRSAAKSAFALLLLLLLVIRVQSQELTIYAIPPKAPVNWGSPQTLLFSYINNVLVKNNYGRNSHPIGHVIVELKDSAHYSISGMIAKSRADLCSKVYLKGYGLGVLFAGIHGELLEGQQNIDDLQKRYPTGEVAFIKFKLSNAAFARLWQYLQEYKTRRYCSIYNGENKPREGKGAGCTAFGVSFIQLAGLLPQEVLNTWQVRVHVPARLIGGPPGNNRRVAAYKIMVKAKWADTLKHPYRTAMYYEPAFIYNWIFDSWDKNINNYACQKEQRGAAKGLVIDCTQYTLPQEPIWLNEREQINLANK